MNGWRVYQYTLTPMDTSGLIGLCLYGFIEKYLQGHIGIIFCKVVVWICWEVFPGIFWQVFVWICWKVIAKTHKLLHLAPLPNMLLLKLEIVWISQNFPNLNILHPNAANTQKEFVTKSQTCSSSKFPKVSHILKVWAQFDVIIRPKSRFGIIQSRKIQ